VILSDLAKYSMTRSICDARSLCDSWDSCKIWGSLPNLMLVHCGTKS